MWSRKQFSSFIFGAVGRQWSPSYIRASDGFEHACLQIFYPCQIFGQSLTTLN